MGRVTYLHHYVSRVFCRYIDRLLILMSRLATYTMVRRALPRTHVGNLHLLFEKTVGPDEMDMVWRTGRIHILLFLVVQVSRHWYTGPDS
jgi:hypothetical protein